MKITVTTCVMIRLVFAPTSLFIVEKGKTSKDVFFIFQINLIRLFPSPYLTSKIIYDINIVCGNQLKYQLYLHSVLVIDRYKSVIILFIQLIYKNIMVV